ncbi:MAG TPA: MarR family transcriptional regulator [Gaiellaceae bacterium]|nr:MarR family transcriptional regulator [Gaiellaceae bacterium]
MVRPLKDDDYEELLALRTSLRRFLQKSESFARGAGLTPVQHQLLLAIRGHSDPLGPTIGDAASYLLLRHHSAVELVDRAEAAGLVMRGPDPHDARVVRLSLTKDGKAALERLSERNLDELRRLAEYFRPLLDADNAATSEQSSKASPRRAQSSA